MTSKLLSTGLLLIVVTSLVLVRPGAAQTVQISPGHNLLKETAPPTVLRVGETLSDLAFKDIQGKSHYLEDLAAKGPVVFVFLSTECPLARRYAKRLARLHEQFTTKGLSIFAVHSNADESPKAVADFAKEMGLPFTVVKDAHGYLARKFGATMTPQAFVVDQQKVLRYRGAIDDSRYENRVKQQYLHDAVTALVAKEPVKVAHTEALGCTLHLPTAEAIEKVTYTAHVARILNDNCVACHRPGQVGPFSLTSYEKARTWAKEIKAYTHARLMPPWKAEPGFGSFQNERRLSDDALTLIRRWVDEGMVRGDDHDLPPPTRFASEWALGKPDLIIEMPEEYKLGAEGEDDYRHFIIPTNLGRDRYIEAIDVRPGNPRIVHHVIAFVDTTGKARELDQADPRPGYTRTGGPGFVPASRLGGWSPGRTPIVAPRGTGTLLQKGGDVILQVHYARTGKVEKDKTKVALYFSKSAQPIRIHTRAALNRELTIPAGAKRHEVRAERELEQDVYALSVSPHMHLLGKEMKVTALRPDGKVVPLVWIKDWAFNWQGAYAFREPLLLPKGTRIQVVAYYDNSSGNPNNPSHPPKTVTWGERTVDEMCIAFVNYVPASEYQLPWAGH